jgi:hypothetical protein
MYFKLILIIFIISLATAKQSETIRKGDFKSDPATVVKVLEQLTEVVNGIDDQIELALATLTGNELVNKVLVLLTDLRFDLGNSMSQLPVLNEIFDRAIEELDSATVGLNKLLGTEEDVNEAVDELTIPLLAILEAAVSTLEQLAEDDSKDISFVVSYSIRKSWK